MTSAIETRSKTLSTIEARAALPKLKRRLEELNKLDVSGLNNETGAHVLDSYAYKINATLREIFGPSSIEYSEYHVKALRPLFTVRRREVDTSIRGNIQKIRSRVDGAKYKMETIIEIISEQISDAEENLDGLIISAYRGLNLHPEISRAASTLYLDGHYSNAVEESVKALNLLVRLRSRLEQDGTQLMERAFSPSNPVLQFNELENQSDKDEQKGFMQMFSGAVSGLRNPRAHGFIHDDPERALEFIAFVSLLAKLLDGTKKA